MYRKLLHQKLHIYKIRIDCQSIFLFSYRSLSADDDDDDDISLSWLSLFDLFSDSEMNNAFSVVCIDLFLSDVFCGVAAVGSADVPSEICRFCEMLFMTSSPFNVILISKRLNFSNCFFNLHWQILFCLIEPFVQQVLTAATK